MLLHRHPPLWQGPPPARRAALVPTPHMQVRIGAQARTHARMHVRTDAMTKRELVMKLYDMPKTISSFAVGCFDYHPCFSLCLINLFDLAYFARF